MDNHQEDDQEEAIESSQVPKLRSKIRLARPNYRSKQILKKDEKGKKERKKPSKQFRDNKTVSQCLRQEWKLPNNVTLPTATTTSTSIRQLAEAVEQPQEDYIKFATQQNPSTVFGIQANPSVSLFDRQEDVVARYIFNETTEALVEEQLQKLLDGFQAEYENECIGRAGSPEGNPIERVAVGEALQSTCLPGTAVETLPTAQNGTQTGIASAPLLPNSGSFIIPNYSTEIAQLEKMMDMGKPRGVNSSSLLVPDVDALVPIVQIREDIPQAVQEKVVPIATENVCLNLSVQKDKVQNTDRTPTAMIIDEECTKVNLNPVAYVPTQSQHVYDVLDLRVSKPRKPLPKAVTCAATATSSKPFVSTVEFGTQTNRRHKCRNVGVQHRPVASFDFTERNLILLAQQTESDPSRLQRKMRSLAKTATDPIWRERDLATVFTMADPYYANLKHFF